MPRKTTADLTLRVDKSYVPLHKCYGPKITLCFGNDKTNLLFCESFNDILAVYMGKLKKNRNFHVCEIKIRSKRR